MLSSLIELTSTIKTKAGCHLSYPDCQNCLNDFLGIIYLSYGAPHVDIIVDKNDISIVARGTIGAQKTS